MESLNTQYPPQFSLNTQNKKELAEEIRTTLEEHGCMVLKFEGHEYLSKEMMESMDDFFALDTETKGKYAKMEPYYQTYIDGSPLFEGMCLVASSGSIEEEVEKLTRLTWPQGNEKFCQTLSSTKKGLLEAAHAIMNIIVTGYGLDKEAMSRFKNAIPICRMWKYMAPEKGEVGKGLPPHVDGSYITILCQNDVQGLKVMSRDGNWFDVKLDKGSFLVLAGTLLTAWSNGRVMAPLHQVMINEEKVRYTFAFGLMAREDEVVEAQGEFVDDENPIRFKPFLYRDYLIDTLTSRAVEGSFEAFAGI